MSFFPKQPSSRVGVTQTIAYDASVAITNAFGPETWQLRLVANSACCYRVGDGVQRLVQGRAGLTFDGRGGLRLIDVAGAG